MDRASVVGVVLESWQAHPLSPSVSVFAAYSLEHLAEEGKYLNASFSFFEKYFLMCVWGRGVFV